jgi:anti-sigma B factor antagonist
MPFDQRNLLDAVYRMAKMSRWTKFVTDSSSSGVRWPSEIYQIFTVPKAVGQRLFTIMQSMDASWQLWEQPPGAVVMQAEKEPKLKLSLETRNRGDVIIVHCQGRIVYRDEAAALSSVVGEVLEDSSKLVLDLGGVTSIDSAGLGELALLQTWAQEKNANLKCAGANSLVSSLLELTNLDSVLDLHPTVESALEALREERVTADC